MTDQPFSELPVPDSAGSAPTSSPPVGVGVPAGPSDGLSPDLMAPDDVAPFGYMIDKLTGARRPKRSNGRPFGSPSRQTLKSGTSPSVDELKATARDEDVDDVKPGKPRRSWGSDRPPKPPEPVPPFRAGPIAKGVNRLYARTAKIVMVMDPEVGAAIASTTRKDSDDDVTVGEAWEELAKINPRIRALLLKLIAGGVYGQLFMCHAPIFLAVIMKDGIRERIPMLRLVDAFLSNEDDGAGGEQPLDVSAMLGGLSPEDAAQMAAMAQQMMGQMASGVPRSQSGPRVA